MPIMEKGTKIILLIHVILLVVAYSLIWGVFRQENAHPVSFETQIETGDKFTVVQGQLPTLSNSRTISIEHTDVQEFISDVEGRGVGTVFATLDPEKHEVNKTYRAVADDDMEATVIEYTYTFYPGNGFGHYLPESVGRNEVTVVENNTLLAIGYSIFTLIILAITSFFARILF